MPSGLARWTGAKALASLSRPNIGEIYVFHEASGIRFLAMVMSAPEAIAARRGAAAMAADPSAGSAQTGAFQENRTLRCVGGGRVDYAPTDLTHDSRA